MHRNAIVVRETKQSEESRIESDRRAKKKGILVREDTFWDSLVVVLAQALLVT